MEEEQKEPQIRQSKVNLNSRRLDVIEEEEEEQVKSLLPKKPQIEEQKAAPANPRH